MSECKKPDCVQNKTHSNAVFLSTQARNQVQENLSSQTENSFKKGAYFDAYKAIVEIIELATISIKLIDNYIDSETLNFFTHKQQQVNEVKIITKNSCLNAKLTPFIEMFKKQYGVLEIKSSEIFHDRFIIIDDAIIYMIGSSIKDAGKKVFMLTKVEGEKYKTMILDEFNNEWKKS